MPDMQAPSPVTANSWPTTQYISTRKLLAGMLLDEAFPYAVVASTAPMIRYLQENHELPESAFPKKEIPEAEEIEQLFSLMFPAGINRQIIGMVSMPFVGEILYPSPALKHIFMEGNLETPIAPLERKDRGKWRILEAGIHILNRCYGQQLDVIAKPIITVINPETKLEQYFKIELVTAGVDVIEVRPKKALSAAQIQELLTHLESPDLWLEYLPPENFVFEGLLFISMTDVTEIEIASQLKAHILTSENGSNPAILLACIQQSIRSQLRMTHVSAGLLTHAMPGAASIAPPVGLLAGGSMSTTHLLETGKYYRQAWNTGQYLALSDLKQEENPGPVEQALIDRGYRSLLLLPLMDAAGKVIGLLELASPQPHSINAIHAIKLEDIRSLIAFGVQRAIQSIDQRIDLMIQHQFTSIHPSVAWKFREIAGRRLLGMFTGDPNQPAESIVFRDVHPLYGQTDIVSSSTIRNRAVQADLLLNLERVLHLLKNCPEKSAYPLLDAYILKAEHCRAELSTAFVSSHETSIVELLATEIHPFLREICQVQGKAFSALADDYFAGLDPSLHIIYQKRKAYEDSVAMLNQRIGKLLESSNETLQKTLPHFFEYFKTDGVEYNLYVGASLAPEYPFSVFQLKNVRLWQLVNMCEITRLVHEIQTELPVPLATAQLIFVYNNALSIRFKMDEKRFDVDGAYNVRYEIIKKRIDKALVKGKNERLTVKGKIAIVYLQEKDRKEYLEYLDYLQKRGYISGEVEDIDIEKLEGVEGLRAMRANVLTDQPTG